MRTQNHMAMLPLEAAAEINQAWSFNWLNHEIFSKLTKVNVLKETETVPAFWHQSTSCMPLMHQRLNSSIRRLGQTPFSMFLLLGNELRFHSQYNGFRETSATLNLSLISLLKIDYTPFRQNLVMTNQLTAKQVGPVWTVRFCFVGPPFRNSWLGKMIQNPIMGPEPIHPWSPPSLLSIEYWYLSSTCIQSGKRWSISLLICFSISSNFRCFVNLTNKILKILCSFTNLAFEIRIYGIYKQYRLWHD